MPIADDVLMYERDELSTGWAVLSKRYGVEVSILKARYKFIIEDELAQERAKREGIVICLKCRQKFLSEDKINLRFCSPCRAINNEMAANMVEARGFGR